MSRELMHPVTHLTDNYRRDEDSNNYKLLELSHLEHVEIWENLKLIEAWRDMDNAVGFTLDKIGKNVLELREDRNDEDYRKAIKIKIRGNLSAGTVEDLNIIAVILFGENFMSVSETWYQEAFNNEPAAVALHLHAESGQGAVFWQYIGFINDIMAGGVGLWLKQSAEHSTTDYHAASVSGFVEAFIIHNPDFGGVTETHIAAAANVFKEVRIPI